MKGDFTRWTFDASKRYSSVRLQQGRVLLDADWNEQLDIIAYREKIANQEIIGLNGVPDLSSFVVEVENNEEIQLGAGRCYVEGVLCENHGEEAQQISTVPGIEEPLNNNDEYLVYLEVWQHHITAIEEPKLLEPALGGPDTTTRTQTYWQLKASKFLDGEQPIKWRQKWENLLSHNQEKGKLKVESGTELPNDLYRVEIHEVGDTVDKTTFKWARNNASMAARVAKIEDQTVTILKNNQIQFQQEQGKEWWIEITDEDRVKAGEPGFFLKVNHVGEDNTLLTIDPTTWPDGIDDLEPATKITTVRIWEAEARTIGHLDGENIEEPIELEKGLKVDFIDRDEYQKYRTGDYWLIPTRSQEQVSWPTDGKTPDGIVSHYSPLAIVNYESTQWTVLQDCREVFPALTEMARETALSNGSNGRKLSIGVHSYNDARRTGTETSHVNDQLDIQGGKQLTLNVGYWKDELDGDLAETDESIIFSVSEHEVMRLTKDNLSIIGDKNLIVEGTSHLKGVVAIGTEPPNDTIGLLVQPNLSTDSGDEVVGEKLAPTLTANANEKTLTALHIQPTFDNGGYNPVARYGLIVEEGKVSIGADRSEMEPLQIGVDLRPEVKAQNEKDKLAALYINPNFNNNGQSPVYRFGLIVEDGKVGIGRQTRTRDEEVDQHRIGVDLRPEVHARDAEDKLVGLYIKPEFKDECSCGITEAAKYGLIVENGRVAFGPKLTVNGNEEYLVDIGTDGGVKRLKVAGDLEVYGKVTYHAQKETPGDVELGQQNEDKLLIYGKLETRHTSGKLKVTSPLEIQLEGSDTQDFLSLFAANESDPVNGRIVWKKGTVTHPGDDPPYSEEAKEVAAIYSTTTGDGTSSSTGDLRFGTSASGEDLLQDRMVITADGKVGIGIDTPGSDLQVLGTSTLETLVVQKGLEVQWDEDDPSSTAYTTMVKLDLSGLDESKEENEENPTLKVSHGGVCIGAERIPPDDELREADVDEIKLYVDGKVTFAQDLSVFGKTKIKTLSATPELRAIKNGDTLVAVEIRPRFDETIPNGSKTSKRVKTTFQDVKKLGLHVAWGDVVVSAGDLELESGKLAIGNPQTPTTDKLRVTRGSTLLEGDLQVGKDSIALKVNEAAQEVGIGGESESTYKLAVAGATKLTGKLEVVPQTLTDAANAVEIKPAFTGTGIQTAVLIEPTFAGNGNPKFGLHVVSENVALCSTSGGVAIGSNNPDSHKLKVTDGSTLLEGILTVAPQLEGTSSATEIAPTLTSSADDEILTALKINPTFTASHTNVQQLGLLVESGDVAVSNGNVAIGGDSESDYKLVVAGKTKIKGNDLVLQVDDNANEQGVLFQNSGGMYTWRIYREDAVPGSDDASLKISGGYNVDTVEELSDRVTIDRDGNVGIGTITPQGKLQVSGGAIVPEVGYTEDSGILFPKDPGGGRYDAAWIRYYARAGESTTFEIGTSNDADDHIVLRTSGGVGIMPYDPDTVPDLTVPDTTDDVILDVAGKIRTTDAVLTNSDATLKDNIQTLKDGLGKILGLRGVSYQWKDDKKAAREAQIGLVAQEVEAIYPELVSTDSQGIKSLSYSKLIAPLIEAIKEQQGQILELVNQVQQQQTQIKQLQARKK